MTSPLLDTAIGERYEVKRLADGAVAQLDEA